MLGRWGRIVLLLASLKTAIFTVMFCRCSLELLGSFVWRGSVVKVIGCRQWLSWCVFIAAVQNRSQLYPLFWLVVKIQHFCCVVTANRRVGGNQEKGFRINLCVFSFLAVEPLQSPHGQGRTKVKGNKKSDSNKRWTNFTVCVLTAQQICLLNKKCLAYLPVFVSRIQRWRLSNSQQRRTFRRDQKEHGHTLFMFGANYKFELFFVGGEDEEGEWSVGLRLISSVEGEEWLQQWSKFFWFYWKMSKVPVAIWNS